MINILCLISLLFCLSAHAAKKTVRVGSKAFTEGFLLGELAAQKIEELGNHKVVRQFGLGSTGVVIQALMNDQIDVYPEYTGTIAEAILHEPALRDREELNKRLLSRGLVITNGLGFQNTYALAVKKEFALKHNLKKISDLLSVQKFIRTAFSHEFMSRSDGLKGLEKTYQLDFGKNLQSIDHTLGYQSIQEDKVDLIAVYSTDFKIETLGLILLEDDKKIFPPYEAVFLAKSSFPKTYPEAWASLQSLEGRFDEKAIRTYNGAIDSSHESVSDVVSTILNHSHKNSNTLWKEVRRRTLEHLELVGWALAVSIIIGIPLGVISHRQRSLGQFILVSSALIQTVPSLALLCLLIPFTGIGFLPAILALCLYSFLPVVQNTLIGFQSIDKSLVQTAAAIGLTRSQILKSIEFPLASRSILAGLRTSAIIGIGTATLAALIGAGGYGAPIISGLATNNIEMILSGAIPCTALALITYVGFEVLMRVLIPKGIR